MNTCSIFSKTKHLHLVLCYNRMKIASWHVDALFAVHDNFKLHSDGMVFLSEDGGGIASGSTRKKINI